MEIISENGNTNDIKIIGKNGEDILAALDIQRIQIVMKPNESIIAHMDVYINKLYIKGVDYHYYFNEQSMKDKGYSRIN